MDEYKEEVKKGGVSILKLVIIVVVLLAIGFGAWYAFSGDDTGTLLGDNAANVIAVVNGEEISRADFDRLLIKQTAVLGEPQDDEQKQVLQNQVLNILTSQALLLQEAEKSGLSITDAEVDLQISQIRTQFPDEQTFANMLVEQDYTEESLRDFIENDLLMQSYINSQIDLNSVTVSDEEIKNEYDLAVANQDGLPELEVLSEPIRTQLIQQKQQQLVSELIDKLSDKSDIETFLE